MQCRAVQAALCSKTPHVRFKVQKSDLFREIRCAFELLELLDIKFISTAGPPGTTTQYLHELV